MECYAGQVRSLSWVWPAQDISFGSLVFTCCGSFFPFKTLTMPPQRTSWAGYCGLIWSSRGTFLALCEEEQVQLASAPAKVCTDTQTCVRVVMSP
jgi:hypothetical protein